MAKPGDVISKMMGFTEIVMKVDEDGHPIGGLLIPPGNQEFIDAVVADIKRRWLLPMDPQDVIREAERIIEDTRSLDNHKG